MQATEKMNSRTRYALGDKPHLYLLGGWGYSMRMWACISRIGYGYGSTPTNAYDRWLGSR